MVVIKLPIMTVMVPTNVHFLKVPREAVKWHKPTLSVAEVTAGEGPRRHARFFKETEPGAKEDVGMRPLGSKTHSQGKLDEPVADKTYLGLKLTVASAKGLDHCVALSDTRLRVSADVTKLCVLRRNVLWRAKKEGRCWSGG